MMALLASFAMQVAPPPANEDEIVVLGRRLMGISVIVGRDTKGKLTCALNESSGNARLDASLCKAATKCVRDGANDRAAVGACIDRRKPELLDEVRQTLRKQRAS